MMKSVFCWRKPEYPEETTDLRQVADYITYKKETAWKSDKRFKINTEIKCSTVQEHPSDITHPIRPDGRKWFLVEW